jgi:hypothetical protein
MPFSTSNLVAVSAPISGAPPSTREDIMNAKSFRRLTALAMLAALPATRPVHAEQAATVQTQATAPVRQAPATKPTGVLLMLVPTAVAAKDNAMKGGCWARIYSGTDYSGDTLTLSGPLSLADMTGPFGLNWDDKVDSIELGPKATLTVFDNEAFRDQIAQFKPGQKVPNISKALGLFDEFASVRLSCR